MATIAGKQGYATLDIVDAEDRPLEKRRLRYRFGELWCRGEWGEEFGVKCTNTSADLVRMHVYIDGTEVLFKTLRPGQSHTVKEMHTKTITTADRVRTFYQPFTFAQPDTIKNEGDVPLTKLLTEPVDKLGRVTLEVYDVIVKKERRASASSSANAGSASPGSGSTSDEDSTGGGGAGEAKVERNEVSFSEPVNEAQATKKGAFISTTKLGARERVEEKKIRRDDDPPQSSPSACPATPPLETWFYRGENLLQKLELRYGRLAQLLILGVDKKKFMVKQPGDDEEVQVVSDVIEIPDSDNEEEGEGKGEGPARKKQKTDGSAGAEEGGAASLTYGNVAQLLLLGVDPAKFRVNQRPEDIQTIELDNDDEDEDEQERKKKRVKKEKVKEEKKAGAGASSSTGRVKTEPGTGGGGGGAGNDDVWDLT